MTEEVFESEEEQVEEEHWFKQHWRPAMAYTYLAICLFDFMLAPMLTGLFYVYAVPNIVIPTGMPPEDAMMVVAALKPAALVQWAPLTLGAGGFFHITMCTVLGISSYTRGKEKVARID